MHSVQHANRRDWAPARGWTIDTRVLPEHRIEYVKFRERVVWHKEARVDLVFGTGSGGDAARDGSNPVKIETVMATYGEWLAARDARRRRRELGVTVFVERRVASSAGRGHELWAALQSFAPILTTVRTGGGMQGSAIEAESDGAGAADGGGLVASVGMGQAGCWAALGDGEESGGDGQAEGVPLLILIHDSLEAKEAWECDGGVFIHFQGQHGTVVEDVVSRRVPPLVYNMP